jgi:hypothetical protein
MAMHLGQPRNRIVLSTHDCHTRGPGRPDDARGGGSPRARRGTTDDARPARSSRRRVDGVGHCARGTVERGRGCQWARRTSGDCVGGRVARWRRLGRRTTHAGDTVTRRRDVALAGVAARSVESGIDMAGIGSRGAARLSAYARADR